MKLLTFLLYDTRNKTHTWYIQVKIGKKELDNEVNKVTMGQGDEKTGRGRDRERKINTLSLSLSLSLTHSHTQK